MDDCIFCKIVNGEIPAVKLYEDENVLSFLDIAPASKGHALVITKKHYSTLLDVPHEELGDLVKAVQKIGAAVMIAINAEGFNVLQSNHKAAGQVIPHVHFHIIPRKEGDNLSFSWEQGKAGQMELQEYQKLIKSNL